MSITKNEFAVKFGPHQTYAMLLYLHNELNALRTAAGLPQQTKQDLIDNIDANMATVLEQIKIGNQE